MDIKGILAIGGKPGLYKMVSQSKTGLIVEGMDDKKRFPVYTAHQISALEEISIYTYEEDVPLVEVFEKMFNTLDGKEPISPKSSKNDLLKFFSTILPDFNEEQVYASDIKKVIQWYIVLKRNGFMVFDKKEETKSEEKAEDSKIEE
ncbi:MAG: hypothetical protein DRI86_13690 [Bacteroidetes bacterium]|nr:MAG: hypothetical protein DRI86_13690 [Bacteroidota bacterium]